MVEVKADGSGAEATYTAAEIKAIKEYLERHPTYVLLDPTGLNQGSVDWSQATELYFVDITADSNNWVEFIEPNDWPSELSGKKIRCCDLSGHADTNNVLFAYKDNWNENNQNDYYKTKTYTVASLKGKLYEYAGTYQSTSGDDNGKTYYTLRETVFDSSPLSGQMVYLDTTSIEGMTESVYIKIIDSNGSATYKPMNQCYNQEKVYQYKFEDYVLPGTTFQFVNSAGSETVIVPSAAVGTVDSRKNCYNGSAWVEYVPEASTVQIFVNHNFSDKGGATVMFTKNREGTGKIIDIGTSLGSFYYDFADKTYDGFYIKQKEDSQTGNTTVPVEANAIREAVQQYGSPLTLTVGGWIDTSTARTASFGKYVSLADSSLNIPSGTFTRDTTLYYVNSTFYDYYSDEELNGNNRKNLTGSFDHTAGRSDKLQATKFNKAISDYFQNTSLNYGEVQSPLYFGEFTGAGTAGLTNFVWMNNNGEPNRVNGAAGARQELVNSRLVNDQLVMGNDDTVAPYFNEAFLRGNNSTGSELGYVFPNVQFPFVKNSDGYWEFNSYDNSQTLRMKQDSNGTYFLDRVGASNEVKGHTSANTTDKSNFFPFNDHEESGDPRKLNYAFGVRLDIPFYMTEDGKVTVENSKKDIEFDFSGDDDVWIFIDDELILDIGGDHGAVTGKINFADCKATTTTKQTLEKRFNRLASSEEHTLTMFYMERGLWESNMKITFNFPQSNALEVEKEVEIPDNVNNYFSSTMDILRNTASFPIEIKNLVTSGETVTITGQTHAVDQVYDAIDESSIINLDTPKSSSVCQITSEANRSGVLDYYYPNEKKINDGQEVTDGRSFYIKKQIDLSSDQLKNYGYLQFDTYVNDNASPSSPFIALIDKNGNKIGAWTSVAVYGGGSNSMLSNQWKTLKVDISKLTAITGTAFDYAHVEKIQVAYWDDVHIYFDDFRIKAPAQYQAGTGFTKDQSQIPDYGSYESKKLEPIEGAEYTQTGISGKRNVEGSNIYLKNGDKAVFSDQFRRESYLSVIEDCDSSVFDTNWTIYENESRQQSGSGTTADDGRTEPSPGIAERNTKPEGGSVLFKSFNESLGESLTNFFDIKVKFVNTLKTGNLMISKELKEGQTDSREEYVFQIEFTNIAGISLENQLETRPEPMVVRVKAGESTTINGIPAGTIYTITEVPQEGQEYTLVGISRKEGGNDIYSVTLAENSVSGTVTADESSVADKYVFKNDVNPSTTVEGTKIWSNISAEFLPQSITLKLQRKIEGGEYEPAKDMDGKDVPEITVTNDTDWKFLFHGIPKYNGTGSDKKEYIYRVVETKIGGTEDVNKIYTVTGGEKAENGLYDITNTYNPMTTLKIKKVDATDSSQLLAGVTFKLEKQDGAAWSSLGEYSTGDGKNSTEQGIAQFSNLSDGTYRLTEVKTKEGYSLLKEPIEIVIHRAANRVTVSGEACTLDGNVLNITISNRRLFDLPATGGYGRYIVILGGLVLAGLGLLMYRLQKRRKGGLNP